jgi:hypothetical protein
MGSSSSKEDDRGGVNVFSWTDADDASKAAKMLSNDGHLTSMLQISLTAKNLKNMDSGTGNLSDPFAVMSISEGKGYPWVEIGRTEIVMNSLSPAWVTLISVSYSFEKMQLIKVDVYDADDDFSTPDASRSMNLKRQDFQGSSDIVPLALIVGGKGQSWTGSLGKGRGTVTIHAEEVPESNAVVSMSLRLSSLPKPGRVSSANPFVRFSRLSEIGPAIACYRTDVKMGQKDACFELKEVPLTVLAAGDIHRPLQLETFSWSSNGKHVLLGTCTASLSDLISGKRFSLKGGKSEGVSCSMCATNGLVSRIPSFFDYLAGGMSLSFQVAIDFTASNGPVEQRSSLHYHRMDHPSPYASALSAVGGIIEFYDKDKKFPVWGFGGKPGPGSPVQHCFPLNGNEIHPEAVGLEGILSLYSRALELVTLSGPTLFAPVISQAAQIAASLQTDHLQYTVLLIITDGQICDMQSTKDAIVAAAELPLSIIIVGVGGADFSSMDILDGDDEKLVSSQGQSVARDIVQFVEYSKWEKNLDALAREVLYELPAQVTDYMKRNNILPGPTTIVPRGSSLRDVLTKQHSDFRASQMNLGAALPPPPYAPR